MLTVAELLAEATTRLRATSPTPRLDAELLLAHTLRWSRTRVLAERMATPTAEQEAAFRQLLARRIDLEPVAYLVGEKEFYGRVFEVSPDVLVPRPDTELLIEVALGWARRYSADPLEIADIGVGSGIIAATLAAELPQAHVVGVDVSAAALAMAQRNVERLGLAGRVILIEGDLLAPLPHPVDLLASNPPYTLLEQIDENVRRHEPHLALDGGADGLALYRRLLAGAPAVVRPGGCVILEIGAWQGADVAALAQAAFPAATVSVHRDLADNERVVLVETARKY